MEIPFKGEKEGAISLQRKHSGCNILKQAGLSVAQGIITIKHLNSIWLTDRSRRRMKEKMKEMFQQDLRRHSEVPGCQHFESKGIAAPLVSTEKRIYTMANLS